MLPTLQMEMKRARRPRSGEDSASQALGCGNEGETDGEAGGGNGGRGGELGEETGDKERGDSSNSPSRLAVQGKGWEELRRDAAVVIWMEIKNYHAEPSKFARWDVTGQGTGSRMSKDGRLDRSIKRQEKYCEAGMGALRCFNIIDARGRRRPWLGVGDNEREKEMRTKKERRASARGACAFRVCE
jgi:hypothetical protein